MAKQLLAHLTWLCLVTDPIDYLQHVQQNAGIIAAVMAEYIKGSPEQLVKVNQLQDQSQPVILVSVIRAFFTLLDELRQTLLNKIQAGHRREGVVDRWRHGADCHFDELVDRVDDILGGCASVSNLEGVTDLSIQVLINPSSGSNQATWASCQTF